MSGLTSFQMPLLWRRIITLIPAIVVLALGADATWALILSQVVLSFGIPFALVPLILLTRDKALVGEIANGRLTSVLAWVGAIFVTVVNGALIMAMLGA